MKIWFIFFLIFICCGANAETTKKVQPQPATLTEMLGFDESDKLLIINADDAGMSHGTNQGVIKSMTEGLVSSASIMVPCPWASEIANFALKNPDKDFGVHLTHTSEWKYYRWSPLTSLEKTPGLRAEDGFMHRNVKALYCHSTALEAYLEGRAQIGKALKAGINVSHIDSHMGAMMYDSNYALMYIRLAKEFDLPLRVPSYETLKKHKAEKIIHVLDGFGLIYPDYLVHNLGGIKGKSLKEKWLNVIQKLKPGVTEIYIHPASPSDETKAITHSWKTRAEELRLFTEDKDIRKALEKNNIKIIGYKKLKKLQRNKASFLRKHLK